MAHTYALGRARASATGNPITFSYTVAQGDTVIVVMLKVDGATNRAGGSLTWGTDTFTQANSTQKAAASPEASAELWYLLNPTPGTQTLTIPNTGSLTVKHTVGIGRAKAGGESRLGGTNGSNGTSTNPTPGAITPAADGAIFFAVCASGITTWAPTAQGGTVIANTDDGAHGSGEQYFIQPTRAAKTMNWTIGSDDWGAVAAAFDEVAPNALENYMRPKGANTISVVVR